MISGDDFRDLAPLDPRRDPERWERMVSGITRAAAPELARRARMAPPGIAMLLSSWLRPALSAAALVAAAAGAALVVDRVPAVAQDSQMTLAAELGYPAPVASWVETGQSPAMDEMVSALEGDTQ